MRLKPVFTYSDKPEVLPQNVNCCDIRDIKDRPCGHEPSDYNEDCVCDCKHFIWIRVWDTLRR